MNERPDPRLLRDPRPLRPLRKAIVSSWPSLTRSRSWWSIKSKSIYQLRLPKGIDDVVRPRDVTYSVTCHE